MITICSLGATSKVGDIICSYIMEQRGWKRYSTRGKMRPVCMNGDIIGISIRYVRTILGAYRILSFPLMR